MKSVLARRRLTELRAQYELEPTLHDFYVEGPFDGDFFRWVAQRAGLSSTRVYQIEQVDLPRDLVAQYTDDSGNRGRVIALGEHFCRECLHLIGRISCIVDRDGDLYDETESWPSCVLSTNFSCLEMFCCDRGVLEKYFGLGLGLRARVAEHFWRVASGILPEVFVIRHARGRVQPVIRLLLFTRFLEAKGGEVHFDTEGLIERSCISSGAPDSITTLTNTAEELRRRFVGDPRYHINSHDLAEFLSWYLRNFTNKRVDSKDALRQLLPTLEYSSIADQALIRRVIERAAAGQLGD